MEERKREEVVLWVQGVRGAVTILLLAVFFVFDPAPISPGGYSLIGERTILGMEVIMPSVPFWVLIPLLWFAVFIVLETRRELLEWGSGVLRETAVFFLLGVIATVVLLIVYTHTLGLSNEESNLFVLVALTGAVFCASIFFVGVRKVALAVFVTSGYLTCMYLFTHTQTPFKLEWGLISLAEAPGVFLGTLTVVYVPYFLVSIVEGVCRGVWYAVLTTVYKIKTVFERAST